MTEEERAIIDAVMAVSRGRAWFSQSKAARDLKHVLWEAIDAYEDATASSTPMESK